MESQEHAQVYNGSLADLIKIRKQVEQHIESKKRNDLLRAIDFKIELIEKQEIVEK